MPELPEIETVRLQLQRVLPGMVVRKVQVLHGKSLQGDPALVEGKKVQAIRRRAKLLLVDLEEGIVMAIHFKMTGQLVFVGRGGDSRVVGGHPTTDFVGPLPSTHTRVIFHLSGGKLYFNDQRLFGWIKIGKKDKIEKEKFLQSLGPEPFDITQKQFVDLVSKRKKPIKLVLMDQQVISGVGNIYANDACWEARVNPRRLANTLTAKQYRDLYAGLTRVLKEGIKYGGATAADAKYVDLRGLGGHYQEHFRVYEKEGQMCSRGDGIIHRLTLGGRGTYFCPQCQR